MKLFGISLLGRDREAVAKVALGTLSPAFRIAYESQVSFRAMEDPLVQGYVAGTLHSVSRLTGANLGAGDLGLAIMTVWSGIMGMPLQSTMQAFTRVIKTEHPAYREGLDLGALATALAMGSPMFDSHPLAVAARQRAMESHHMQRLRELKLASTTGMPEFDDPRVQAGVLMQREVLCARLESLDPESGDAT